jgi:hypothetical protein
MAILNLSDQAILKNTIAPKIQSLKTAMNARKVIWDKLSSEKKEKWITSDKDPIELSVKSAYRDIQWRYLYRLQSDSDSTSHSNL